MRLVNIDIGIVAALDDGSTNPIRCGVKTDIGPIGDGNFDDVVTFWIGADIDKFGSETTIVEILLIGPAPIIFLITKEGLAHVVTGADTPPALG